MTTYVCGHRNPDTDAIVSAMGYAALCNALGDNGYIPVRLGPPNDETSFLLKKFGFEAPMQISNVRTQVRDIEIERPPMVNPGVPISHVWEIMGENQEYSAVPVVHEDGSIYGIVTTRLIAESDMRTISEPRLDQAPVYNILNVLEGHILNENDDAFDLISGNVIVALPAAGGCLRGAKAGDIVLCGQQEDAVEQAFHLGAGCVILCQSELAAKYKGLRSDTCVITTPFDVWRAARLLHLTVPVGRITKSDHLVCFHLDDYLDDVREIILKNRYRCFPVLDQDERVVGLLNRHHLLRPNRKRVVLVDHNEVAQSIPGLDQAEIAGVIDHHRLADVQTGYPTFMRNEPVGSSTTIVATMFQENGLMPGEKLAGLMAAAIVSDTVMFKSPTATPRDRKMAERLAKIAGIDLEALGREVFSASSSEKPVETLLNTDFKEFHIAEHNIGISQLTTMDTAALLARREEFLSAMGAMKEKKGYDLVLLMITDVLKEGTELLFLGDRETVKQAFGLRGQIENQVFLKGVVSRKKQVVPALALLWG